MCCRIYDIAVLTVAVCDVMTKRYDVAVVGGGPAGSSAALKVASAGLSCVVLEREPEIATTVRTSGVTWMDTVREFGIPDHYYNTIQNYGFCSPSNSVLIRDEAPGAAVLDVRQTYRWLARLAQDAGCTVSTGVAVQKASRDDLGVLLHCRVPTGTMEVSCKMAIDASGFGGILTKSLGLAPDWRRFGVGAEYELEASTVDPDTWWLMVGSMYSPAGYAWIFPTGSDTVRVGVGVAKPECVHHPRAILDRIMAGRIGPVAGLGHTKIIEYHYGLIPNGGIERRTAHDRILLVGDAAGQANPLVLEGIRYAIRFGRLAGQVASSALLAGDTSSRFLGQYEKQWRSVAESKIRSAYRIQNRWLSLNDAQWDDELRILGELHPDEFLDFVKADFGMSRWVRLAANHPRLAVRQLFGMIYRLK